RAQIRHEQLLSEASLAGIYFGYEWVQEASGPAHRFWRVSFNATFDQKLNSRPEHYRGQELMLWGSHVYVPFRCSDALVRPPLHFPMPSPGQWNELTLRISPDNVEVNFADQRQTYTAEEMYRATLPPAPEIPRDCIRFNPRGGLGCFVRHGSAS